ncbi:hypothetical protein AB5I39_12320 [Sphingomonas sp. MMS24-J45]|uniref:hypothetical protein n=1 Tax=Sphingomonas sp. MMS24-J45 TaxID=3238806 RepID=UPI00384EBC9C
MPIRKLVITATLLMLAVLCLGGVLAASRINAIRIGGPMETSKHLMSDLVADILPPPEYIIEPFFEATVLLREPERYDFHAAHLAKLQKDYDDRHAFWLTAELAPELHRAITEETHLPASQFWTELNTRFFARGEGARSRRSGS